MRIIYFHTGVDAIKKGALTDLFGVAKILSIEQRKRILNIYLVHPSLLVSVRYVILRVLLNLRWLIEGRILKGSII